MKVEHRYLRQVPPDDCALNFSACFAGADWHLALFCSAPIYPHIPSCSVITCLVFHQSLQPNLFFVLLCASSEFSWAAGKTLSPAVFCRISHLHTPVPSRCPSTPLLPLLPVPFSFLPLSAASLFFSPFLSASSQLHQSS